MRLVLSRKGFDSANGGCASPLFDDGTAVSLPIPGGMRAPTRLDALRAPGTPYPGDLGTLAWELSEGRVWPRTACHLDPDLTEETGPATAEWQPAFG